MLIPLMLACIGVVPVDTDLGPATPPPPTPLGDPPVLEVQFPPSGDLSGESVAVFGTASGSLGGPVTVTVTTPNGVRATEVTAADPFFRIDGVALDGLDVSMVVEATDAQGHTTEQVIDLTVSSVTTWGATARVVEPGGTVLLLSHDRLVRLDPVTGARELVDESERWVDAVRIGDDVYLMAEDSVYQLVADEPRFLFTIDDLRSMRGEPGGTMVLRAFAPYQLYRWDPSTPTAPPEPPLSPQTWPLPEASDGQRGYYAVGSGQVRSIEFATGVVETVYTSPTGAAAGTIFTTLAGVWLHLQNGELVLLDAAMGTATTVYTSDMHFDVVASEPDALVTARGDRILRVSPTGQITVVDEAPLGAGTELPGCEGAALDPSTGLLYTACRRVDLSRELWSIDTRTGDRAMVGPIPSDLYSLTWDESGDRLLKMLQSNGALFGWQVGASSVDLISPAVPGGFHEKLQTDGQTAWVFRVCDYCQSGDLVGIDLATGVRTSLPSAGDTLAWVPGTSPTVLVGLDERLYAFDLASGTNAQIHTIPGGSSTQLHALGPDRALAVGAYGTWRVDLAAGTLTEAPEPWLYAFKRQPAARDGAVLYDVWEALGLALDPETGQTVVFSR